MNNKVDIREFDSVEFGVCVDVGNEERHFHIPTDDDVQKALAEMLVNTLRALEMEKGEFEAFEPAQKYGATERLIAPLEDAHMETLQNLYAAENLETSADVLSMPESLVYYFAIFRGPNAEKLVAVRRASQFKGVIKARSRLVSWIDDSLKIVTDDIFKLDLDFDYLILPERVLIYRPVGFEFTAGIDERISQRAVELTSEVAKEMPFIDFNALEKYVASHKRAARLMAGLRMRDDLDQISPARLRRGCKKCGIEYSNEKGIISPLPGHEMAFLEYLDRRRYEASLIEGQEELYVAPNRRPVSRPTTLNG